MRFWLIIIGSGLVTYLTRASFIVFGDKVPLPPVVERSLKYVAPASFAAISVPLFLGGDGIAGFGEDIPRIIAGAAAAAVIWRWKNIPASLVVGMGLFWLLG